MSLLSRGYTAGKRRGLELVTLAHLGSDTCVRPSPPHHLESLLTPLQRCPLLWASVPSSASLSVMPKLFRRAEKKVTVVVCLLLSFPFPFLKKSF